MNYFHRYEWIKIELTEANFHSEFNEYSIGREGAIDLVLFLFYVHSCTNSARRYERVTYYHTGKELQNSALVRPMSVVIPSRLRLAPAQVINAGPHINSSHFKHVESSKASRLFFSPRMSDQRQVKRHTPWSHAMLSIQHSVQVGVKPTTSSMHVVAL